MVRALTTPHIQTTGALRHTSDNHDRLFGSAATGRTSRKSLGVKLEHWFDGDEYEVEQDSCLKAYVRLIAGRAEHMQQEATDNTGEV